MTINNIVKRVNRLLAGEQLVYSMLEVYLDETIDDINSKLNSTFPTFSELGDGLDYSGETEYDALPDRYIRDVVIKGAAYKFYITDEEGISTAEQYGYKYEEALFRMVRDYAEFVPEEYQSESRGSIVLDDNYGMLPTPYDFEIWR